MRVEAMRENAQRKYPAYEVWDKYNGEVISKHWTRGAANSARSECSHRVRGTHDLSGLTA